MAMIKASWPLRKAASGVLSCAPPCDVPQGYASVVVLPAALLDCLSEQPVLGGFAWIGD